MLDRFFKEKDNSYVSIDSYQSEINRIDDEIKQITKTIKFYEAKRKALEEWKSFVKLSIKMESKEEICVNCKYYTSDRGGFCDLFSNCVERKATCPDFVWNI